MRALYNNFYDNYVPDALSAATNYPITNTQNISLDKVWRSTGLVSETVTIDAGAALTLTMDSFSIVKHNLTNAATIKIQGNATDAWGGVLLVDETVTWREDIIVHYFTSTAARFWRILISDAANTDGYIEVGRFFEGAYLQFNPSSVIEHPITNVRNDIQIFSDGNHAWTRKGVAWRVFEYSFPPTGSTMIASIRTMFNLIGKHKPIIFMNYDTVFTVIEPAYCLISNDIREDWRSNKAGYRLVLRETT